MMAPLLAAAWGAIRGSRYLQIMLALMAALGVAGWKVGGVVHDRRIAREATLVERQAAEIRALKAQRAILQTYATLGQQRLAVRDEDLEAQRAEIKDLQRQREEARRASAATHNPGAAVFRADDPWLRQGAAGAGDGRGAPERRR